MDENSIVELEKEKIVTATFRKLSPAKKEKIYKAALKAFGDDIFESVRLDDIAKAAKISKGSLIQYFGLKENLLLFLTKIAVSNYKNYFDDYFLHESVFRAKERIEQYFLKHIEYRTNNNGEFNFILKMLFENSNKLSEKFIDSLYDIQKEYLDNIIERGIETNQLRRNIKSVYLTSVFHSIFIELLRENYLDISMSNKNDFAVSVEQSLNLLFEGVR